MNLEFFTSEFQETRHFFSSLATKQNAQITELPLSSKLSIMVARVGAKAPQKAYVHFSGVHGVEGFAGSAIQCHILKGSSFQNLKEDEAIFFVHGTNPFGMKNLRRFNAKNIDLNRNVVLNGTERKTPELYHKIQKNLNPSPKDLSKIASDISFVKLLLQGLRLGFVECEKSIVMGQYDYPQGIYFGGNEIAEEVLTLKNYFSEQLGSAAKIVVTDVHTGLGSYGKQILFTDDFTPKDIEKELNEKIGIEVRQSQGESLEAYKISGSFANLFNLFPHQARLYYILQEFGTFHPIYVGYMTRLENYYHHKALLDTNHWVKKSFLRTFFPRDTIWQERILGQGLEVFHKMRALAFSH